MTQTAVAERGRQQATDTTIRPFQVDAFRKLSSPNCVDASTPRSGGTKKQLPMRRKEFSSRRFRRWRAIIFSCSMTEPGHPWVTISGTHFHVSNERE